MKKIDLKNKKIDKIISIVFIAILLIALIIFIIIKSGPYNGLLNCTYKNNTNTMNTVLNYNLSFKNKNVTKLETEEIIESDDEELIKTYKESIEELSKKYDGLKYYKTNITNKNNKLIVKTTIEYNKIDMKKYLQIEGDKSYIKNNKLKVKKIKEIYEKNGATCKYK